MITLRCRKESSMGIKIKETIETEFLLPKISKTYEDYERSCVANRDAINCENVGCEGCFFRTENYKKIKENEVNLC